MLLSHIHRFKLQCLHPRVGSSQNDGRLSHPFIISPKSTLFFVYSIASYTTTTMRKIIIT